MKPTHDVLVKSGQYTDSSGQTKNRWQKIGTVFRHDDGGTTIKLECLPVGVPDWQGWCSVFKREPKEAAGGPPAGKPKPPADFDDDITF